MPRPYLFVVGLPGVGKSTLSLLLAVASGARVINSGDALRRFLALQQIPLTDPLATGEVFLEHFNEITAAEAILDIARADDARIIDGVRLFSALNVFRQLGEQVEVVSLTCSDQERRRRFAARALAEGEATPATIADVLARKDAWSADAAAYGKHSQHLFDNSGPMSALESYAGELSSLIH